MPFDTFTEPDAKPSQADPQEEYLGWGLASRLHGGYASMAGHLVNLTEVAGPALADMMLLDERIAGSIRTIKDGVLAQGMQITATVQIDPEDSPDDISEADVKLAFEIEDHCERSWRNMTTGRTELLRRMLDAMAYRTMLAEVVRSVPDSGPDAGLYVLDHISTKEPGSWSFVLDAYGNVSGIRGDVIKDQKLQGKILPREKFMVLPWLPRASRPWGQGLLGEAYNPWNFKVQLYPLLWKYAKLFAIPPIHATAPEKAEDRHLFETDGNPVGKKVPATRALYEEIKGVIQAIDGLGGGVFATPFGTSLSILQPAGEGELFQFIFDMLDRAIVYAMHNTTLSMGLASKRANGTDASSGQDLLGLIIAYGKWALKEMLYRDLWYPHVSWNWGPEVANRFTPEVSFGMTNPEDFSRNSNAISRLWSAGVLATEDERQGVLRFLGLSTVLRSRRKSTPRAKLQKKPTPGARALNVKTRTAA